MIFTDLLPDKQEIIDKLFPSGWQPFVVQILAVLVLVLLFFFFLFKPVRKILKARQDHIEENIRSAEEKNHNADAFLVQAHDEIKTAKVNAQKILLEAEKDAAKVKEVAMVKTEEEIKEMKIRAEKDIEESKKKAQADIKNEIIDVAFLASEKLLSREITKKDNEKIVDDFINKLQEEDK